MFVVLPNTFETQPSHRSKSCRELLSDLSTIQQTGTASCDLQDASQNEEALVTAFDKIEMGAESGAGEAQQNIMDDMTRLRACGEGEENGPSTSDVERYRSHCAMSME